MIEILETPPLNSVQDLGRLGFRCFGLMQSGAMDRLALAAANAMLGNDLDAAGIEVQLFPLTLRFNADGMIAVTGADCRPRLDGWELPPWWATPVSAGQTLTLSPPRSGMRSYLAVSGGLDVPMVLGSRSTQLREGFGGLDGRSLQAGDRLRNLDAARAVPRDAVGFGVAPSMEALPLSPPGASAATEVALRVIPAGEYEDFDAASQDIFWNTGWTVTAQSNRQGYRLQGVPLRRRREVEMRSHGIVPGVVQVPPSGQPILQLADGNSAGGYPKIGVIIDADLWRVAQAAPGRVLRFLRCTPAEAKHASRELSDYLSLVGNQARYLLRHRERAG